MVNATWTLIRIVFYYCIGKVVGRYTNKTNSFWSDRLNDERDWTGPRGFVISWHRQRLRYWGTLGHHLFSDWLDWCKNVVFVCCILDEFPYSALESKSLTQARLWETEICLLDISQSAVSQRQQVCMSTTTTIKFCYLDACLFHQY